jgi:glycerol-3-phosphate acyltransferase PlsY
LGVLVGAVDVAKAYLYLLIVEMVLRLIDHSGSFSGNTTHYRHNTMFPTHGNVIVHCLPFTNHFRVDWDFHLHGFVAYFAFTPTLYQQL